MQFNSKTLLLCGNICSKLERKYITKLETFFRQHTRIFTNGEKIIDRSSGLGRRSIGSMATLTWLQEDAKNYAEKMPDANVFHFQPCQTRTSIHQEMKYMPRSMPKRCQMPMSSTSKRVRPEHQSTRK